MVDRMLVLNDVRWNGKVTRGRGPLHGNEGPGNMLISLPKSNVNLIRLKRMALDLETLRTEIQTYLNELGVPVFHGYQPLADTLNHVAWDTERYPNYKEFVAAGNKAGVKLIVFHHEALSLDQIDEALERLEDSDITREEKRNIETRLRQLQAYEGFTCRLDLSFSIDARTYVFELHTEWYEALNDILGELEAASQEEEETDNGALGGYFSNN